MYTVLHNDEQSDFETLQLAMDYAKIIGKFVTIVGSGYEIVGIFGADAVKEGKTPDGVEYSWYKRRLA